MEGIYLFDIDQDLIKYIPADSCLENYQDQELNGKIIGTATVKYDLAIEEAIYYGVKDENNFWMYKIRNFKKTDNLITIDGIHIFFDELKGVVIRDIRPQNSQASLVVEKIIHDTGWKLGFSDVTNQESSNYYYQSALSAFYEAAKKWNFEFIPEVRFENGKISEKRINIYKELSRDYGKWYEYGDKLIDIVAESSIDELYTAFLGRGKGIPIENANGELTGGFSRRINFKDLDFQAEKDGIKVHSPEGQDYIELVEATKQYGYPDGSPRIGIIDFDDIEDVKLLADATFDYAIENSRPKVQLKASVIERDSVELGETVSVIRPDMNMRYKVRVFKIRKDFLQDKITQFEFGDKVFISASERLKSESYNTRKRNEMYESYLDSLREDITASYLNEDGHGYNLKIGNSYNLPAGYYSFNRPIDQDPTKVIYIGSGKILISNEKNEDGTWKWKTAGTGDGLMAETIVGTLGEFAKVNAAQINVNNDFFDTGIGSKIKNDVVMQNTMYNNVKITPSKGLQVLDASQKERVQLGNWAPGRYGLKLSDADGNRTILDDNGILQSYQDTMHDNLDNNFPLDLPFYIPKECSRIYKAVIRLNVSNYRAYHRGSEYKGGDSDTTSGGQGVYNLSITGETNGGQPVAMTENSRDVQMSDTVVYVTNKDGLDYSQWVRFKQTNYHTHGYTLPPHYHGGSVSIGGHYHSYTIPGHQHLPIFGIYEDYSNTTYTVRVNGAYVTQSRYDVAEIDVTNYLTKGGWNNVQVSANGRGRATISLFIQYLMNYNNY